MLSSGGTTHALRCLCGVAPVTRSSGKSLIVTRRLAAHDRLRDAAYHWARIAAQRDPASHDKYRALRARGHGHPLGMQVALVQVLMKFRRSCLWSHFPEGCGSFP